MIFVIGSQFMFRYCLQQALETLQPTIRDDLLVLHAALHSISKLSFVRSPHQHVLSILRLPRNYASSSNMIVSFLSTFA